MSVNLMLEVGCGTKAKGKQYAFDPKIKADVYVDIEKPEVKIDSFVLADAQFLPFKDKAFINVYASHLIEHLPNPLKFLKEARRVSYGKLYLWLPNKFGKGAHQDPSHLHTFTYFSLKKLLKKAGYSSFHAPNITISGKLPKFIRRILMIMLSIFLEELQIIAW